MRPSLDQIVSDGAADHIQLVAIGGSRGAFRALQTILGVLSADFPLPVVIALHRMPESASRLAETFSAFCALPVIEPDDKQPVVGGVVWLAPASYHLLIDAGHFALSRQPPVNYSIPSIDVLFESVAAAYGSATLGILLSGASSDGATGLGSIRRAGGETLIENPGSAFASAMPTAALAKEAANRVLRLADLSAYLQGLGVSNGRS